MTTQTEGTTMNKKPKGPKVTCSTCGDRIEWSRRCGAPHLPRGEFECPDCVHDRHVADAKAARAAVPS